MAAKIAVISGGTATNELVSLFRSISPNVAYILPILDNGGSTSEILRVIGGPAIGDIRSRLTRLIPPEQEALRQLLSFRLSNDSREAKAQWEEIVDGTHSMWGPINQSTKEIIRAFLIHLHVELLKRAKPQHKNKLFRYELANVGNLFLTGVRLFIGSLDSAIELFIRLTGIDPNTDVIPCINTNFTYHISALLENGLVITGQSQISHPSAPVLNYPPPIHTTRPSTPSEGFYRAEYFPSLDGLSVEVPINDVATQQHQRKQRAQSVVSVLSDDEDESGSVPQYTHPELKKSQLHFNKTENIEPLLSPIQRIFYISPYGEEICPTAHNRVISTLSNAEVLVYSIGSLMTSIVPVVLLKGVGKAIAHEVHSDSGRRRKRVLLLNGCEDRETFGMDAVNYVEVIVRLASYSLGTADDSAPWDRYVTHLFHMKEPRIAVDQQRLREKGIVCVEVARAPGSDYYDLADLEKKLQDISAV